jgi:hypothetical protein
MGQAPIYDRINRAGLYSSKARESPQPGPAVFRAGNHLAVVCLSFGVAFAAFVSGSLEQRIANLFFFGLTPAIGFYAGGNILGQLLVFGVDLCDMIMARCFRYAVRFVNDLLRWAAPPHQAKPAEVTPGSLLATDQMKVKVPCASRAWLARIPQ